ncbi:hypothetical protein [Streptomyces shenzhenensis]|uniref:hypothetical protein n=1 Tax=Streptomyces shenzhenensis TaxID=943815 RepID=UPI0036BC2667
MTDDAIPGRGQYTEQARAERLAWLLARTGATLDSAAHTAIEAASLTGNLENFAGSVEVPVGLAGPLQFRGQSVQEAVVAPMATTEGALVASASRGARALSLAGGVHTRVLSQRMSRAPVFEFDDLAGAARFSQWLGTRRPQLEDQVRLVSQHARLVAVDPYQIGRYLHVRFVFETADAAGQNMTTAATWQICTWLNEVLADEPGLRPRNTMLEGNLSSDKKVSPVSLLAGRGTRVTAECIIPGDVVVSVLKTTPAAVARGHRAAVIGGQQAGMTGYGINAANVIAALFVATGQDVACVHESGVSVLSLDSDGDDLIATLLLPNLVIGTVGGGTGLPDQRDWLGVLGCRGEGSSARLAEIIAGFALALDVSTASAMVSGQFADAHRRLGRARPVNWLRADDLGPGLLQPAMAERLDSPRLRVTDVTRAPAMVGDGISTELGALGERRKLTGVIPMTVRWTEDNGLQTTAELVAKVKPRGEEIAAGIGRIASLCGPEVSSAWETWGGGSDFPAAHRRELAVFRRPEGALTGLLPVCYGVIEDEAREAYVILMERLDITTGPWSRTDVDRALRAIAPVHGHWLGRDQQILAEGWLHRDGTAAHLVKARELWEALVRHNAAELPQLMTPQRTGTALAAAAEAEFWVQEMDAMPRTLVHNDFNPRNISRQGERVIAYDWELATVAVPQRDLAELLAFTLTPHSTTDEVDHHLEVHRAAVAAAAGPDAAVPQPEQWRRGYGLALREMLLSRLQLYTAAHSHRELPFLPAVLDTAFHLWNLEAARDGE